MTHKEELISYRRKRAQETLHDARILFNENRLYSAVNRIYYALFYEISALLVSVDRTSARHSGVRAIFNEHFVKVGKVSVETGKFYTAMFDFRQKSDYGDFVQLSMIKCRSGSQRQKNVSQSLRAL